MTVTSVIYPGTFDPITHGHTALLARAVDLFGHVVVALPEHERSSTCFTLEERVRLIEAVISPWKRSVDVLVFSQTLVECAVQQGINVIVRGIRDECDSTYELRMARINRTLQPTIETVFLASPPELSHISASMVREVAASGGQVDAFVDPIVREALYSHYRG